MSEFDRQSKLFAEKVPKPDVTYNVCSVMKAEYDDGEVLWYLTDDDQMIRIDMRESRGENDLASTNKD